MKITLYLQIVQDSCLQKIKLKYTHDRPEAFCLHLDTYTCRYYLILTRLHHMQGYVLLQYDIIYVP